MCPHPRQVRMGVDDPLDSSAIHCGSGVLGCVVSGFLAKPQYVMVSRAGRGGTRAGLGMGRGPGWGGREGGHENRGSS